MAPSVVQFVLANRDQMYPVEIDVDLLKRVVPDEECRLWQHVKKHEDGPARPVELEFDECGCEACQLKQFMALMNVFKSGSQGDIALTDHMLRGIKKATDYWQLTKVAQIVHVTEMVLSDFKTT